MWTATDACGASVSATQTITVLALEPAEPPTLIGVPDDVTVACGASIPEPALVTAVGGCAKALTLNGLVLHYPFTTDDGAIVLDASGNSRTGMMNGATWDADGISGGAVRFDDINQFITASDAGLPSGGSSRSLSWWFTMPSIHADGGSDMFSYGTQSNGTYFYFGVDWRNGRRQLAFSPWGWVFLSSAVIDQSDTWYHAVFTYGDGGAKKFYINGVEQSGYSEGGSINTVLSGLLRIGPHEFSQHPFTGKVDEVRMYDRVLASDEVAALHAYDSRGELSVIFAETNTGTCPATITRVWTATDACGASVSATQTITVLAPEPAGPPTLVGVPDDVTVACNAIPAPPAVTATGGCATALPEDDLILHYTFDDPANLGADSSPEENDGVPVNAQSGVGISGSSLLLTGNGYVNVGPFADFHASMEHSYGGWFKPSAVRSAMGIIGNTQSGNVSFHLTIDTINGNYGMDLQRPEIYEVVTSLGKSVAGEWQHGMVTYDGHQAKVYYNGELVATSRYYETAASVVSNGLDTVVGNTATDRDWGFRGDLDDIRVYRRALTAEQIRALASPTTQAPSVVLTETVVGSCPGTITRVWTATDACGASVSATQTITVLAPPPVDKDTDGDGLLDSTEVKIGTDPKKPDTDGDGRSDGIEVQMGTDPLVFDAFPHFVRNDFDGDLISDLGVYDHVSGAWHIFRSRAGYQLTQYGFFGTTPVPGDYDGDKKADIAVFDPANFVWYINGSAGKSSVVQWGFRGTVPMPADYDGDGRTDIAVYHGRFGLYYVNGTKRGTFYKRVFLLGGQPVAGDFDGDRAVDFAVYQPSSAKWKVVFQAGGSKTFTFGDKNARGVAGDYDADGRADFATFNPATGVWNILGSVSGPRKISMPEAIGGQPVTGYYYAQSKNNRVDPAVYLPVTGEWLIWGGEGILLRTSFGSASTTPLGAGP